MSKIKEINPITDQEISAAGVVSLAVRPNQHQAGSQYGEGNLSAKELQKRFDRLASLAIARCNMLTQLLSATYDDAHDTSSVTESILEYIKVKTADGDDLPGEFSLKEIIDNIITIDGQLKVVDPASNNQDSHEKLNTVLSNLYNTVSESSRSLDDIYSKLPRSIMVGTYSGSNTHYFALRDENDNVIEGSVFPIDLFLYHNEDDNAHDTKFSSIETTVTANKNLLQQQINNCQARVDNVVEDIGDISRDLGEFKSSVNTVLDSDDKTLDQLQEIVDYIKNNKGLIDGITTSKVSKTSQTVNRVAYINDRGTDTTMPIINDVKNDMVNFNDYSIACRNKSGCITVANPIGSYDAVNLKTMNAALAALKPNIDLEKLKAELDKRYAQLSDFEAVFNELHEYAQNIILGVSE